MKETMKRHRARMPDVKVDWINRLPDDLLIHVLSYLSTKEAVQTCLLSKRWKRVWANLPILKFNMIEFGVDDSIGASDEALRKSITRFYQFVSAVVDNLESTHLDSVSYIHDTKPAFSYKVPMQWLERVALLMPQLIDISISKVKSIELPDSLFACATLRHLKIELHRVLKTPVIPASINLPSLKVFDLRGICIQLHENFAQNVLMGCPSLVTLKLFYCALHFSRISSNTLKELLIIGCHLFEPIQVSCPSLFSLRISSYLHGGANISLKNMKFLKITNIALTSVAQHFGGGNVPVLKIIGSFSNATKLCLCIESPELKVPLKRDILKYRNFNNVEELLIGMCGMSFDFNLLASLLKLSPNVEKLTLVLDVSLIATHEEHNKEFSGDVLFQHKYIEMVEICDWYEHEFPEVLMKTFTKTLNAYVKEIGSCHTVVVIMHYSAKHPLYYTN